MLSLAHLDHLGDALRRLRSAARFTQADLCGRAGLRSPQLSRWENGHEVPTLESLVKLLSAVGAGLADLERVLLGEVEEMRRAAVARELRQIRSENRERISSRRELRLALQDVKHPNPEGLEPRSRLPEEKNRGPDNP